LKKPDHDKQYYLKNIKKIKQRHKQYSLSNPEKIRQLQARWHAANPTYNEQYQLEHKENIKQNHKQWRLKHPDIIRKSNQKYRTGHSEKINQRTRKWQKQHLKTNLNYKIKKNLRNRILNALKGCSKSQRTMKLLGCNIDEFKSHIEKSFATGMTWDNYGKWVLHHVKHCHMFDLTDPEQQKLCFHYTNVVPMWEVQHKLLHASAVQ
jgi:hypothetical protein